MSTDKDKLISRIASLSERVQLKSIFNKASRFETLVHPSVINDEECSLFIIDSSVGFTSKEEDFLISFLTMEVYVRPEDDTSEFKEPENNEELLSRKDIYSYIKVELVLEYSLEQGERVDEKLIQLFTETTASYNAYPYFREHVESYSKRLGIKNIFIGSKSYKDFLKEALDLEMKSELKASKKATKKKASKKKAAKKATKKKIAKKATKKKVAKG